MIAITGRDKAKRVSVTSYNENAYDADDPLLGQGK